LQTYNRHTSVAIKRLFIDHGEDGLMSLQLDLNCEITNALASLELYKNYNHEFWEHGRWLDPQIISSTSNIILSLSLFKKGEDGEQNSSNTEFHKKLQKIQDLVARFSKNKTKPVLWHMQALKAAMHGVVAKKA
jgi:hypothetical protein